LWREEETVKATAQHCELLALAALVLLAAAPVAADTFNVDRFDDSTASLCSPVIPNDCGLRGAILEANSNPGDDVVRLQDGTYVLSIFGVDEDNGETGDLDVTDSLVIEGKGPELTVVDAGGIDRVFHVHSPGGFLTLRGVTVTGGNVGPPAGNHGGGISVQGGSLRLEACAVDGNSAVGMGGAIYALEVGPTDLVDIVDSWITGNSSEGQSLYVASRLSLVQSTVSDNVATGAAGAVLVGGDGSLLSQTTISGHVSASSSAGGATISATGVTIHSCTLAHDTKGVLHISDAATASVSNTVIDGYCTGMVDPTSAGGNLESPGHSCGFGASDLEDVPNPFLSSLGWFGGPTPVHRPLAESPAIDAPIAGSSCPDLDQRGLSRPQDGDGDGSAVHDIGAVELAAPGEIFVETFECGFTTPWSDVAP
jgi:hypothetical protein